MLQELLQKEQDLFSEYALIKEKIKNIQKDIINIRGPFIEGKTITDGYSMTFLLSKRFDLNKVAELLIKLNNDENIEITTIYTYSDRDGSEYVKISQHNSEFCIRIVPAWGADVKYIVSKEVLINFLCTCL